MKVFFCCEKNGYQSTYHLYFGQNDLKLFQNISTLDSYQLTYLQPKYVKGRKTRHIYIP